MQRASAHQQGKKFVSPLGRSHASSLLINDAAYKQGQTFTLGLAYWPGGTESDWGPPDQGLQPCNPEVQANLV
jgi:hypothetical protein